MSIPYELIVKQDLNLGYGTVSVTMPGGGSATGDKVGIHTLLPGMFNVRDFGAVGDGATNDYQAVQDALDAAASAGGGTVYFPRSTGTYRFGVTSGGRKKGVVVGSHTTVTGDPGAILAPFLDDQAFLFALSGFPSPYDLAGGPDPGVWPPDPTLRCAHIAFRHLRFSTHAASADTSLFRLGNFDDLLIDNCVCHDATPHALFADVWGACTGLRITNNIHRGKYGLWLRPRGMATAAEDLRDVVIAHNVISTTDDETIAIQGYAGKSYNISLNNNVLLHSGSSTVVKLIGYDPSGGGWGPGATGNQQIYAVRIQGNIILATGASSGAVSLALCPSGVSARFSDISIIGNDIQCPLGGVTLTSELGAIGQITIMGNTFHDGGDGSASGRPVYLGGGATNINCVVLGNTVRNWNGVINNLGGTTNVLAFNVDPTGGTSAYIESLPHFRRGGVDYFNTIMTGGASGLSGNVGSVRFVSYDIANNAATIITTDGGLFLVYDPADATHFILLFHATSASAVVSIAAGSDTTVTKDNAGTLNVYGEAAALVVQNKTGVAATFFIMKLAGRS